MRTPFEMRTALAGLALGLLAGACASAPEMRFYTLSEVAPIAAPSTSSEATPAAAPSGSSEATPAAAPSTSRKAAPTAALPRSSDAAPAAAAPVSGEAAPVRVVRIGIPGELDRPQLVRRADANRLQLAEQDRWAAPLDEMILRVLSADLAARMPGVRVAGASDRTADDRTRALSVDIQEFSGDTTCAVVLRATWMLKMPNGPGVPGTANIRTQPSGACSVGALPAAMSNALAQMSDGIVAALSAH